MLGTAMVLGVTIYMGWSLYKEVKKDMYLKEEEQKE